jgi:hypothetical protein
MRPISELANATARWNSALRWRRHFTLTRDGDTHASIAWESATGSIAVARWADGLAVFERVRPAATILLIRDMIHGREMGVFVSSWTEGGKLSLPDGRTWTWRPESAALSRWAFRDEQGRIAVETRVESLKLTPTGSVTVAPHAIRMSELPLLTTLAWHLVVQTLDDGVWLSQAAAAR